MKKTIILIFVLLSINVSSPQSENIDTMLKKITSEKDDNTRIDLINDLFSSTMESDPLLSMQNAQKLLSLSQKNKDNSIIKPPPGKIQKLANCNTQIIIFYYQKVILFLVIHFS